MTNNRPRSMLDVAPHVEEGDFSGYILVVHNGRDSFLITQDNAERLMEELLFVVSHLREHEKNGADLDKR